MSPSDGPAAFADEYVVEPESIAHARQFSIELGVDPVSPSVGAQLALLAAAIRAKAIIEIGTGAGVSGLWLLAGAPQATLTSIDNEPDHHLAARQMFGEAGFGVGRIRLISGRALDVLPRMNEESYDLVFIDADAAHAIEYVEHGLRLVHRGGLVLLGGAVGHAMGDDDGLDASAFRSLLEEIGSTPGVLSVLSPAGTGLLQIIRP